MRLNNSTTGFSACRDDQAGWEQRQKEIDANKNTKSNSKWHRSVRIRQRSGKATSGKCLLGALLLAAATAGGMLCALPGHEFEAYAAMNGVNSSLYTGPGALGGTTEPRTTNTDRPPVFEGGEVRFLADRTTDSQQLSALIKSADGKLIVVDGGVAADTGHLLENIKELGGVVDAWMITHPQADHAGGLLEILEQNTGEIEIKNIYYNFHDRDWYQKTDPAECGIMWRLEELFQKLPAERIHGEMKRGDTVQLSESLSFRVMNDPYLLEDAYSVNNSSLMYDVELAGKHIVFLGDIGPASGDALLKMGVFDGISADFVQMAHHGQHGASEAVYQKLAPKACIWPAPKWLYQALPNNTSGFNTYLTRSWVDNLGVEENYGTMTGDVRLY